MEQGKVSLIAPSYNCQEYLSDFLDSVLTQTYTNWELIVVDDGSKDKTVDILKKYSIKDSRIKDCERSRSPKGAPTCRNIGFEKTSDSEYICYFDSDDLLAPYCIEQRVKFLSLHPDLDFAVFPAKTFNITVDDDNRTFQGIHIFNENHLDGFFYYPLPFIVWNNIYRKDSLVKYDISWDEKMMSKQDADFNIVSLMKGMKGVFADEESIYVDYYYRKPPQNDKKSISSKIYTKDHLESHMYFLHKLMRLMQNQKFSKYRKSFKTFIFMWVKYMTQIDGTKPVSRLLSHPYMNNSPFLKIRFKLYSLFISKTTNWKPRAIWGAILFPMIAKRRAERMHIKRDYCKSYHKQFISQRLPLPITNKH